ncbi:hypothetical protein PHMEG_00010975 [Phytophthora megakarya]|uniref:Uncharacterized protein n=1 Tax=Phytophthora megakarya TaxID=4795 RepID=A0A225WEU8_9STRA|nr:hypothetical protein PHMEG_00010975 [Phytophthora megakarya]
MAEVEQDRARWKEEATRALGAQQEALAAEQASLQQLKNTEEHRRSQEASEAQRIQPQFQDLRATVATLLHPDATTDPKSQAIGDPDSSTQKSSVASIIKATLPEVKEELRVKRTKAGRRASSAPKAQTVSEVGESSFRQPKSGDSGSTKSGSGKKSPNRPEPRKPSTSKAREDPGSPPSDPGDDSDASNDDGDNSDSSSSGSEDSLDNDDGSGTAAAKTTKDSTMVWNFRPYINYNEVEIFNGTAPKEDRVNWWERFTDMAAQGSWPDKMKIRQ